MKLIETNNLIFMDKHLETVLKEMCSRVDAPFEDLDFQEEGWFKKHQWKIEEEDSFKEWLTDYLYTNKEAQKELLSFKNSNKNQCKKAAQQFVMNYGWTYKDLPEELN